MLMGILKRLLSLLTALVVIAIFYVSAVMLEGMNSPGEDRFTVEAASLPLVPGPGYRGSDAQALADAFGAPLPVPEGLLSGETLDGRYHTYPIRKLRLEGRQETVLGVRPASAAPAVLPKELVFTRSDKALLGYPLMQAQADNKTVYALVMKDAAFYIVPGAEVPGGFSLYEPRP